ncbi:NADH-quinone oxidoreductase subunit NuoB [Thermosphaera aggregans]|jgi:NADH-quinone oxidoreductase subunit B|uniref:NADH dehydrogenase (Ubiquinone) 30 kDa subunit n=1 Tax=Thermosphaera aggregans (strain DSM 11486 / M11TL) TaxID=633148 RepID=D5U2E6_THEAM|nr:NADH-quinone oxidoreductase subunit NuoB [Thermosphaera aggregans]ADG91296.1 NADH dehydrogenase (ubiquinone) 30 kDa subunit [Thermosphaera aggregans DSM 11486]
MSILDKLVRWARSRSIWMIHYCSACGAVEFPPLVMSPLDWERYGYMPAPSPRQSDLYVGMGYLTKKTVKLFLNMYRQVPEPRFVAAGCNCTATGGLYWDSYATYKRLDEFVEVEGWVPGCMPMPDDYFSLLEHLRRKIASTRLETHVSKIRPDAFEKIARYEELEKQWLKEYMDKASKQAGEQANYAFTPSYPECYEVSNKHKICKTSVEKERLRTVLKELKDQGFSLLININAVDYPEKGVIELYYVLENPGTGEQKWVKTFTQRLSPIVDSVHDIYPLALYIEREVYEMMGVEFRNHPSLRKWILEGNWEGPPPLRKDVDTVGFVVKVMYGGYKYGR